MSKDSRHKANRRRKSRRTQSARPSIASSAPYFGYSTLRSAPSLRVERSRPDDVAQERSANEWHAYAERIQSLARLDQLRLEARHIPSRQDVGIYDDENHRVATVWGQRAQVDRRGGLSGDFAADGDHWDRLHQMLAERGEDSNQPSEFRAIPDEHTTALIPDDVSFAVVGRAKQDSNIIWDHFKGLACPVELPGAEFTMTFWPANEHRGVVGVPFEYKPDIGAAIYGRLCLRQRRGQEVVPVAAASNVDPDALWIARVVALSELAHLVALNRGREAMKTSSGEHGKSHLREVASAFVRPYVRHLRDGHHASPRAIQNATLQGVELSDGETFVSGHLRQGEDRLVRFDGWTASIQLGELAASDMRAA